jgi:hypothetical protein
VVDVEIAAEDDEDDGGDAHYVGSVAADAVGFHALTDIAFQNIGKTIPQERNIERGETLTARAGSDVGKSLGISAESDGELIGEIRAMRKA